MPIMTNCCQCGCGAQSDCSAVGGVLLGSKFNAGKLLMRIGGTMNPAAPFPRFPRWSHVAESFVASVHNNRRCAKLLIYTNATHNGSTYNLDNACCTVMDTAYRSGGASPTLKHRGGCDAYDPNVHRYGWPFDASWNSELRTGSFAGPRTSKATGSGFDNCPFSPWVLGSGSTKLYGGNGGTHSGDGDGPGDSFPGAWKAGGIRYEPSAGSHSGYWWKPTAQNLLDIYGVVSSFAPAAGVPHTLILYVNMSRSKYLNLNWDGVSWPAWWTANGITASSYAAWKRYITAWPAGSPADASDWGIFQQFIGRGRSVTHGHRQWLNEPEFAFREGYADTLTSESDSRVVLQAAHIICAPCENFYKSGATFDSSTTTITTAADCDLLVGSPIAGCCLQKPTVDDAFCDVGTPYKSSIASPGCWDTDYYVPLTFTGTGTTHLHFGSRSYTLIKT